jgi:hypothetical protein
VRGWILQHGWTTIPEIEKAAYRLVALQVAKTIDVAAQLLDLEVGTLCAWIDQVNARCASRSGERDESTPWKVAGDAT